jgi:hypothetical protein
VSADHYFDQRELIMAANQEQKETINNTSNIQMQAINDNTNICLRILDVVGKNKGKLDVLAAVQHAYSSGAPGIMIATSPTKVEEVLRANDTRGVGQLVLHMLRFREIDHRYERVALAHRKTFEWLFLPPMEPERWANFPDFLQDESKQLYWITGKPGAGKSTLMRFLLDHPKKSDLLNLWSNGKTVLTAFFFFWNSGTKMQMSYEGLVRSLLYQLLKQAPELIPIVFPYRVLDGMLFGTYIFGHDAWSWSWEELIGAFRVLLRESRKVYNLFLLVDGMDEFQDNPSELIEFVKGLQMPGVKICASSRPWNQFQDAFGHGPQLRVEWLTSGDIKQFVVSRLTRSPAFLDYEVSDPGYSTRLIETVCEKSDGVFLWVQLVARSLLEGLSDGEKPSDLNERIESLPTDLEDLFDKILGSLDARQQARASQYFQLHRNALRPLTLLDLSFADEDDPDFVAKAPLVKMRLQQAIAQAELMKRRINACTRGLLEVDTKNSSNATLAEVGLLHRTVKDYLGRPDIWKKLCSLAPTSFICDERLFNYCMIRLKTMGVTIQEYFVLKLDTYWEDVSHAAEYVLRSPIIDAARKADLLQSLDALYVDLVMSPMFVLGESKFVQHVLDGSHMDGPNPLVGLENCRQLLRVAIHCKLTTYLDRGLRLLPDARREQLSLELLEKVILNTGLSKVNNLPSLACMVPNQQLALLLVAHGADPNRKLPSQELTVWEQLLERCAADPAYRVAEVHALVTDMIQHGADSQSKQLTQYLDVTKFDTTEIRAAMRLNQPIKTQAQVNSNSIPPTQTKSRKSKPRTSFFLSWLN